MTKRYICDDGSARITLEANSAAEAAQEYVDGGDWGDHLTRTTWISVYVYEEGDEDSGERFKITIEPTEPDCSHADGHDWRDGLARGPYGSGGGVKGSDICGRCGLARHWDTWAQDRTDGEQGLSSTEYRRAGYGEDEDSTLADHLDRLDVGDLEQEEIAEGSNWQVFLSLDPVSGQLGVVYVEDAGEHEVNVDWYADHDEAREDAAIMAGNLRASDEAREDD